MKIINSILFVLSATICFLTFNQVTLEVVTAVTNKQPCDPKTENIVKIMELIKKEQPEMTDAESYEIAEANIKIGDEFKCIDPVLLMAIQKVESDFDSDTRGTKGELGINQILPKTGKELCTKLGWEYNERILYDIKSSTYLAYLYLDYLYQRFGSLEAALMGYNCGPTNALRFTQNKLKKIPPQGFDYVHQVLHTYIHYQGKIKDI